MTAMSDFEPPHQKRERVAKACTHCRKKKIKCDGNTPCRSCGQSGNACIYPSDTERKPKPKTAGTKVTKSRSIQLLDNRLAKLETLILGLTSKLAPEAAYVPGSENEDATEDSENETDAAPVPREALPGPYNTSLPSRGSPFANGNGALSSSSPGLRFSTAEGLAPNVHQVSNVRGDSKPRPQAPTSNVSSASNGPLKSHFPEVTHKKEAFHMLEKYYGSHSMFHIFSENSIEWIKQKLPENHNDLLLPLSNFSLLFSLCMKTFSDIWFAPRSNDEEARKRLVEGWFPDEEDLITDLMDCFEDIFLAGALCNVSDIKILFRHYYNNKVSNNKRKFKYSELLIMNISLAISISAVLDKRMTADSSPNSINGRTPTLFAYSTDDLLQLQTRFFSSSIYYYDMISVMSDGIRTVQAILLLIIYLETSWIKSSVNYILSSIAVRYAQEIGLHRYETFVGLPQEEADFRRKIWWYCEYLDMEICYRNGKPPLINSADVSTLTSKDLPAYCAFADMSNMMKDVGPFNPSLLQQMMDQKGMLAYTCHFLNMLNKVRTKSYTNLFSASCASYSFSDIIKTLKELNKDMFFIADAISPPLKPRFYNDPEFYDSFLFSKGSIGPLQYEFNLTFQLTFFTHLMTINRLISQIDTPDFMNDNEEVVTFRNLAIDSARTILHIAKGIDRSAIPFSCINWVIYYPFGAFLILLANCINRPSCEETFKDVNLMVEVLLNFFAFSTNALTPPSKKGYSKIFNQRESVTFIVSGVMLNLGIRIIESRSNFSFIDTNPQLQKYLHDCRLVFPQLFQQVNEKGDFPHTMPTLTESTISESTVQDSPFSVPRGMQPGPTGYMTIPFETPKELQELFSASPQGRGFKNSLSDLLHPSPGPFAATPLGGDKSNYYSLNTEDVTENLDKILSSGTPNFFFDNSVGF